MENQEQEGKVQKQFDATLKTLIAVLGEEKKLLPSKRVPTDKLDEIVTELFKEETEANEKALKDELKTLLKNYAELKQQVKAKEKELKQLEETKMKEFNQAAQGLFRRIEGLTEKERQYYQALNAGISGKTE